MGDESMITEAEVEVAQTAEDLAVAEDASLDTDVLEAKEGIVEDTPAIDASNDDEQAAESFPKVYADNFLGKCQKGIDKAWDWVKKKLHLPTLTKKQKAMVWDKFTTGLLIFLFCTPFLVLLYILLWFLLK